MKIELHDTFNGRKLSTHRTVIAAVKAQRRHLRAVKRTNSSSSYLTYGFYHPDGSRVSDEHVVAARIELDRKEVA